RARPCRWSPPPPDWRARYTGQRRLRPRRGWSCWRPPRPGNRPGSGRPGWPAAWSGPRISFRGWEIRGNRAPTWRDRLSGPWLLVLLVRRNSVVIVTPKKMNPDDFADGPPEGGMRPEDRAACRSEAARRGGISPKCLLIPTPV